MMLCRDEWAAMRAGTGPLKHPQSDYLSTDLAALEKNVPENLIKRAIYNKRLLAECPLRLGTIYVLKSELAKVAIKGRKW